MICSRSRRIDDGLVRKSPTEFPAFTLTLAGDAKEQTLRTIVDHLVTNELDLRELYTTRKYVPDALPRLCLRCALWRRPSGVPMSSPQTVHEPGFSLM